MSFDPRGYVMNQGDGDPKWFLDCRMTVVAGGEQSMGALTVIEWSAPVGFAPPMHIHHNDDEAFYVLDGELTLSTGATAGPGAFVFLPRGIAHTFVVSGGPLRGLQITAPAGFERFVDDIGRPAEHDGFPEPMEPDVARLAQAAAQHGIEIVGPPLTFPSA